MFVEYFAASLVCFTPIQSWFEFSSQASEVSTLNIIQLIHANCCRGNKQFIHSLSRYLTLLFALCAKMPLNWVNLGALSRLKASGYNKEFRVIHEYPMKCQQSQLSQQYANNERTKQLPQAEMIPEVGWYLAYQKGNFSDICWQMQVCHQIIGNISKSE